MRSNAWVCVISAMIGAAISTAMCTILVAPPRLTAAEPFAPPPRPTPPFREVQSPKPRLRFPAGPAAPQAQQETPANRIAAGGNWDAAEDYTPEERVNIAVYEAANRGVVNIDTKGSSGGFLMLEVVEKGQGSGSVIDKLGHIVTNYHVVEGAKTIQVALFDGGKSYEAKLVGRDAASDIAVIKIDAPAELLFPIAWGDSTRLKVGQRIFAIGNPFGMGRTLTAGIISSLNRTLPLSNNHSMKSIIQIDAAINPGNSGGPLLDRHARLIGMNTAISSHTGENTGVGFAIPVSSIARVVPQLLEKGHVTRPDIGITRVFQSEQGLYVATMTPGGPAEQAGLRGWRITKERKRQGPFVFDTQSIDRSQADLIVAVDGEKTLNAQDFVAAIESKQPGQEVTVTIVRGGRETPVRVKLIAGE